MYRGILYLKYFNRSANSISDSTCLKNSDSNMVTVHINILLKTLSNGLNSEVTKYGEVWCPLYFINNPIPQLSARVWGQRLNNFPWDNPTEWGHMMCSNLVIVLAIPDRLSKIPHARGTVSWVFLENICLYASKLQPEGTTTLREF